MGQRSEAANIPKYFGALADIFSIILAFNFFNCRRTYFICRSAAVTADYLNYLALMFTVIQLLQRSCWPWSLMAYHMGENVEKNPKVDVSCKGDHGRVRVRKNRQIFVQ